MTSSAGRFLEGAESCWEDAETIVYSGRGFGHSGAVLVRLPKQRFPTTTTIARLVWDYETAKLLPPGIIVSPLAIEQYGDARAVILEDTGARPIEVRRPFDDVSLQPFLEVAILAVDSIDKLHASGAVHANLTAHNLWRQPDERAIRLFDFSRAVTHSSPADPEAGRDVDVRYAAPELLGALRQAPDHRTDYYGFGVVLYNWLTGHLPFDYNDPAKIAHGHIARLPPSPATVAPFLPETLTAIVLKLLEKDPEERYQTAAQLRGDLHDCLEALRKPSPTPVQPGTTKTMKFAVGVYGRQAERSALLQGLDRARRGDKQVVLIAGPAGVGKSALMANLREAVADKQEFFIAGKFDQYKRNIPYAAVVQAFQQLVSILLGEPEERLAQWRDRLSEALGSNRRVIADVIPQIKDILDPIADVIPQIKDVRPQAPIPELGPLESRNRFYKVFRDFLRVFANADHPLCILMDDLQWADAASFGCTSSDFIGQVGDHFKRGSGSSG